MLKAKKAESFQAEIKASFYAHKYTKLCPWLIVISELKSRCILIKLILIMT